MIGHPWELEVLDITRTLRQTRAKQTHGIQEVRHYRIQINGKQWSNEIMRDYEGSTNTTESVLRKKREAGSVNNEEHIDEEWDIHPDVK